MARLPVKKKQAFPAGWRRAVEALIDEAAEKLGPRVPNFAEGIHDARTCAKKIRAALRLVRGEIGEDVYARENAFFRDNARQISSIRDAQVIVETLANLRKSSNGRLDTKSVDDIQSLLRARLKSAEKHLREERQLLNGLQTQLREAKSRMDELQIRDEFAAVAPGLRRAYKSGRQGFARSQKEGTAESYHEWRKCAKYLRYQLNMLRVLWPGPLEVYNAELKALSDLQGEDHDLFVFQQLLLGDPQLAILGTKNLLRTIKNRRKKLQKRMPPLAMRLYAETPNQFLKRMETYWNAWRL